MASMSEKDYLQLQETMAAQREAKNPKDGASLDGLQEFIQDANEALRITERQLKEARHAQERLKLAIVILSVLAVVDILTRLF